MAASSITACSFPDPFSAPQRKTWISLAMLDFINSLLVNLIGKLSDEFSVNPLMLNHMHL